MPQVKVVRRLTFMKVYEPKRSLMELFESERPG